MFASTFCFDNGSGSYIISVSQEKTQLTAAWLRSKSVQFRPRIARGVTNFYISASAMPAAVAKALNKKFNASTSSATTPSVAPKTVAPVAKKVYVPQPKSFRTQFSLVNNNHYELIVDNSVAIATTAYLEKNGCDFDRYVSESTTRYVFNTIAEIVVAAITKKYGCVKIEKPQPVAAQGVVEVVAAPETVITTIDVVAVPVAETTSMTAEYEQQLIAHDWRYEMSDDSRVWKRGEKNHKRLLAIASSKPELQALYKKHFDKNCGMAA